jgi:Mg2+ and Co2+ transporter CorA
MQADGHLLLVLHEPPGPDDDQRVGRFFWRDAEGSWKSNSLGTGTQALRTHLAEFAARIDKLEEQVEHAASAEDYFQVLQAIAPLHRTIRNLHVALQQAREMLPLDRELIVFRDQANDLERAAELLHTDAKNGLDYTIAHETEKQSWRIYEMTVASHRLNLLAAMFFPIATLSAIFGMNLGHGLEQWSSPHTFYLVLGIGLVAGLFLMGVVAQRPTPPQKPKPPKT